MKCGTRVALGVGAGYFLGRRHKMRLAMMLAAAGASSKLGGDPRELLTQGLERLSSSPEVGKLTEQVRVQLVDAVKSAALTAATSRVESLNQRLRQGPSAPTGAAQKGEAEGEPQDKAQDEAEGQEKPQGEAEDEGRDEAPDEAQDKGQDEAQDKGQDEAQDKGQDEGQDKGQDEGQDGPTKRTDDASRRTSRQLGGPGPRTPDRDVTPMVTKPIKQAAKSATDAGSKAGSKAGSAVGSAAGSAQSAASAATPNPLKEAVRNLTETIADRAVSVVTDKVSSTTSRLSDGRLLSGGGVGKLLKGSAKAKGREKVSDVTDKVKDVATGGGGGGDGDGKKKKLKLTNIVEQIDVSVPLDVAYDQWTQFADFPNFMKKVEDVDQVSDEKAEWKAQILWSHRVWESTIVDQVRNQHIVWRSKGAKGRVDGAVTFHELAPRLTRIVLVLEYHPQGLFERTGNIWRAQGRRARLELKHFQRHVTTNTMLHPDEIEGWHGEIHDGQVVKSHEDAEKEDQAQQDGQDKHGRPDGQVDQAQQDEQVEQEGPEQTGSGGSDSQGGRS